MTGTREAHVSVPAVSQNDKCAREVVISPYVSEQQTRDSQHRAAFLRQIVDRNSAQELAPASRMWHVHTVIGSGHGIE